MLATSYTVSADKKTYTFTLRSGREVLQRPADDLGGREVLHRPGQRGGQGLGLHRHGHQVRGRAHAVHGRGHPQVPVGAAARRPVAVLQRDRARQLRRRDARPQFYNAPGRHRPVQVGLLAQGQRAQAGAEPELLAEGQAVPGQRHLDRRAQRQHQGAAAQGRPGPDRRVPGLVHGGQPEDHAGRHDEPVQLDAGPTTWPSTSSASRSRTCTCAGRSRWPSTGPRWSRRCCSATASRPTRCSRRRCPTTRRPPRACSST